MIRTLHSEWTKLRTQRGTLVALFMTGVLMVGFSAFFASEQETDAVFGGDDDLVQMGLMGIAFAEIAVVVAGASLITAEFASGMIRTTLTATQGRFRVLLAKAILLSLVVFPVALAASAVGFVSAQSLLRGNGYRPPAYPEVSLTDPSAARAVVGTALLLTAYAPSCAMPARRSRPASASSSSRSCSSVPFRRALLDGSSSSRHSRAWRSSPRPTGC
jgi:ABC-type transport system involved in multi-copper enzyme maturation permease subunit